ncbi:HCCA isomerase/glutathione S-transferase kappa [Sodiomyces alkalinus F11]|uniref:Glutathione S-transferase kappa n=1 Tax=Sodiomyces alkalinus (strain CBS 110278 / VKM F-3762 / F11) TaxID=1314773 RepID=A0A3N2PKI9_SODAK|nr:HCCA isomerase/glutathione S-transferase kappa [Sodiomyces alkalinus F11]ROT34940.1 HCCA isomerase/glutathione S-transferase kappa [Sodiomyces alkalinus F11]
MGIPKITLYVDTVSPFAYIAYYILRHDPAFARVQVTFTPILLGGLMKVCNNTAPINIKKRLRWAKFFNVPMHGSMPTPFPQPTLNIMRALCAIRQMDKDDKRFLHVLDHLYTEFFVHRKETSKPDVLRESLETVLGTEETAKVLEVAATEGKKILAANTNEAFDSGAFGLPWMVCTNAAGEQEGFFGVDHLAQVANFLGLDIQRLQSGWKSVL